MKQESAAKEKYPIEIEKNDNPNFFQSQFEKRSGLIKSTKFLNNLIVNSKVWL